MEGLKFGELLNFWFLIWHICVHMRLMQHKGVDFIWQMAKKNSKFAKIIILLLMIIIYFLYLKINPFSAVKKS